MRTAVFRVGRQVGKSTAMARDIFGYRPPSPGRHAYRGSDGRFARDPDGPVKVQIAETVKIARDQMYNAMGIPHAYMGVDPAEGKDRTVVQKVLVGRNPNVIIVDEVDEYEKTTKRNGL